MFYVVDYESSCCVDFLLHWDPDSLLCPGMKVDWHLGQNPGQKVNSEDQFMK